MLQDPALPRGERDWSTGHHPALTFPLDNVAQAGVIIAGRVLLMGVILYNANAAAQLYEFYDGTDVNGTPVWICRPAASASSQVWLGPNGVLCEQGLYMTFPAGPIKGAVWYVPLDESGHRIARP
jgi:hypothetical protein